jgi:hypothetical protein
MYGGNALKGGKYYFQGEITFCEKNKNKAHLEEREGLLCKRFCCLMNI